MGKFSFDKEMRLEVKASFIARGENTPVTGDEYVLRLYDKDVFGDDYLGESKLDEAGEAQIVCDKDFKNPLTLDIMPDFYFVLYKDKIPVFQSKVMEDLDLKIVEDYKPGEGEVVDLGTFLIDV